MFRTVTLLVTLVFSTLAFSTLAAQGSEPLVDIDVPRPTTEPGDFVLCPSRQFYDSAVEKGLQKTTFIYYTARFVEAGEAESRVKSLAGTEYTLPNVFIIPIPQGQTANVGDILLTWWQTGSGMQRAIVVGGTKTEPVVRYLDIAYDNPSGAGKREDKLKPDSFVVLRNSFQIGSSVAVSVGSQHRVGQLLAADEERILVKEFAGRLQVYDRANAKPLPIQPNLSDGSAAKAAMFGTLKPITVKTVDAKIGRVFATYQLGRTEKEKVFSFGEILPD